MNDCISRAEALKHSHIEYDDDGDGHRVVYFEDIEELPSVAQPPKIGLWIKMGEGFTPYKCSECGAIEFKQSKYCPNCGAKMEVEE